MVRTLPAMPNQNFARSTRSVIYNRLKEDYTGFSEIKILKNHQGCTYYFKQCQIFPNNPLPKTINENAPGQIWQMDIINMRHQSVQHERTVYNYILQISAAEEKDGSRLQAKNVVLTREIDWMELHTINTSVKGL